MRRSAANPARRAGLSESDLVADLLALLTRPCDSGGHFGENVGQRHARAAALAAAILRRRADDAAQAAAGARGWRAA
jgi:hypothetical protein